MVERGAVMVERVRSAKNLESTAQLFAAHAKSLGLDLSFQDFDTELKSLPGKYASPKSEILLAFDSNGHAVGCVAVPPLFHPDCCEMKRLYILPEGRGLGIGKKLMHAILDTAALLGYSEIKLDTLPNMSQAISLYESAGFIPTTPYYNTPLTGMVFLARQLEIPSAIAESIDVAEMLTSRDTAGEKPL